MLLLVSEADLTNLHSLLSATSPSALPSTLLHPRSTSASCSKSANSHGSSELSPRTISSGAAVMTQTRPILKPSSSACPSEVALPPPLDVYTPNNTCYGPLPSSSNISSAATIVPTPPYTPNKATSHALQVKNARFPLTLIFLC